MTRSAGRGLLNIAHFVLALIQIREPQAHQGRSAHSTRLVVIGQRHPARTCPAGYLRHPGAAEATKIQARRWARSSDKRTPGACADATVDLEAAPGYLPEADVDVGLRAIYQTHRRWPAAFEVLRELAELGGHSGLRSVN
jgi:hypothetical protein